MEQKHKHKFSIRVCYLFKTPPNALCASDINLMYQ